ncbi:hypothetical protein [uncultured Clostridium sp.]|uniref:hypothetical protein n=1 Tax=uncultured Clostridium sp. TaxID=59620 RepID=UPI0028E5D535|nr:hypothetical protein [uncultured Clostridium sp.]
MQWRMLLLNILKDIISESVDNIECEGDKPFGLALFLLSSDHEAVVIATKELMENKRIYQNNF